ncbi:type II toxin-antitoxin system death-on-curing family toxin [Companilactobacillus ginsenosidimutans]|uniref:type II toxin-antitoxin system death-on-curing family toxin n=1 Tax=Companilactobacillus ginsenosidimutans TaxID=1007676 RepID=UPI00065F7ADA|nr:type II toxin-antitoxin system death-on-curing family toxin [Companilactobacillus ginsenosidimutans]
MNIPEEFDGFLICPGYSRKQINQFKRIFAMDNLNHISKKEQYLQMRKYSNDNRSYSLDVRVNKELVGRFYIQIESVKLSIETFRIINKKSEEMFREESFYGIKDENGLDRINNSIYGGFGSYEPYPTVTAKAAALWYKIATNQFFNNGNKRTAMLSAIYLLAENYYTFDVKDVKRMYDISLAAANNEINIKYIERFINGHVSLGYEHMENTFENKDFDSFISLEFKNSDSILH